MKKLLSTLALWLVYVPLAHAQDLGQGNLDAVAGQANIKPSSSATLPVIIGNAVRIFIGALGIIFLLLTVYAGYLYLTARGSEENVKHAKETLSRGVIGMIIVFAAYAISTYVLSALVKVSTGT